MRSGRQKDRKCQGHCVPEGHALSNGAGRIPTAGSPSHNAALRYFQCDVKVPFRLPPGAINLKCNLASFSNDIKVQSEEGAWS